MLKHIKVQQYLNDHRNLNSMARLQLVILLFPMTGGEAQILIREFKSQISANALSFKVIVPVIPSVIK